MKPSHNGGGSKVGGWWIVPALVVSAGLGSLATAAEPASRILFALEPPDLVDAVAMPLGPGQNSWLVMGSEFVGTRSNFIPLRTGFGAELGCAVGSGSSTARAKLPLPDGVVLQALDVWRFQGSALPVMGVKLQQHCLSSDAGDSSEPQSLISFGINSAAVGYDAFSIPIQPQSVDALHCSYYLEVDFGTGCQVGAELRLLGARVFWRTQ